MLVTARAGVSRFRAGQTVYEEGDLDHGFAADVSGGLEIRRNVMGEEKVIAEPGPGGFVGELGSLSGQGAVATVRAAESTEVLWLDRERLQELVAQEPELGEIVMRAFILSFCAGCDPHRRDRRPDLDRERGRPRCAPPA